MMEKMIITLLSTGSIHGIGVPERHKAELTTAKWLNLTTPPLPSCPCELQGHTYLHASLLHVVIERKDDESHCQRMMLCARWCLLNEYMNNCVDGISVSVAILYPEVIEQKKTDSAGCSYF
jgi:hypothetical protein